MVPPFDVDNVFTADEQHFLQTILCETSVLLSPAIQLPKPLLSPSPKTNSPTKRQCRIKTCDASASGYGYCARHTKVCKIQDCTKNTQSKGLCFRHGGGQRCKISGCTKAVQRNGCCLAHGVKTFQPCAVLGCHRGVRARGLCGPHGAGNYRRKYRNRPMSC